MPQSCERAAYKEWVARCQAKPRVAPSTCKTALFRPDRRVAAGAAGWRNHRASCRHPAPARAFPDRRRRADTARRPSGPACRRAARPAGRWSAPSGTAVPACGFGCIGRAIGARVPARAARSGPAALPCQAGPVPPPHRRPPSASHESRRARFIAMGGKRPARADVPRQIAALRTLPESRLTTSGSGSAKNAPSAASAAARSG